MKIPFDIKYRPQIESGEYKLETKDGRQVRVVCWDVKNSYSKVHDDILALVKSKGGTENALFYAQNGYCLSDSSRVGRKDLFIVTPEEELSEFEMAIHRRLNLMNGEHLLATELLEETKGMAAELLALARKELVKEGTSKNGMGTMLYDAGFEDGKAEALRIHATELTKNLAKSGLDKDSIPYHLIEFMCNLYDSQNWKEIEDTAELYVTRIKAAALKDLPRWKECEEYTIRNYGKEHVEYRGDGHYLVAKGMEILVSDLEKLPGFKED